MEGGSSSSPASSIVPLLPGWFRQFISRRPGGQENPTAALKSAEQLRALCVEGADPGAWSVTRYHPGIPCPTSLSDPVHPTAHYHSSNGVFVAVNPSLPGEVFLRCSHCMGVSDGSEDVVKVKGRDGRGSNWVRLCEEGFGRAMVKAEEKSARKQRVDNMVSRKRKDYADREEQLHASRECKKKRERNKQDN